MRKIALGAAVALGLGTSGLAVAGPALADADGACSSGHACLYENNGFNQGDNDHWRNFADDYGDFRNLVWKNHTGQNTDDHMDNETSSIKNRRGCQVTLYQDVGWGGASSPFAAGANDGFLADNNIGDNRASAILVAC